MVLNAGDEFTGTAFSAYYLGNESWPYLNAIGMDAMVSACHLPYLAPTLLAHCPARPLPCLPRCPSLPGPPYLYASLSSAAEVCPFLWMPCCFCDACVWCWLGGGADSGQPRVRQGRHRPGLVHQNLAVPMTTCNVVPNNQSTLYDVLKPGPVAFNFKLGPGQYVRVGVVGWTTTETPAISSAKQNVAFERASWPRSPAAWSSSRPPGSGHHRAGPPQDRPPPVFPGTPWLPPASRDSMLSWGLTPTRSCTTGPRPSWTSPAPTGTPLPPLLPQRLRRKLQLLHPGALWPGLRLQPVPG